MVAEYGSDARRLAIRFELKIFSIENVIADCDIVDYLEELTKIAEYINILTPQRPPSFAPETIQSDACNT